MLLSFIFPGLIILLICRCGFACIQPALSLFFRKDLTAFRYPYAEIISSLSRRRHIIFYKSDSHFYPTSLSAHPL